jgi:hypothetical protein
MPVTVPAAPIPFPHTQTARRRLAAEQSHRREAGGIADGGGKFGVARICDLAPEAEPRREVCRCINSLFGLKIPCSGLGNSLLRAARESRTTYWNGYANCRRGSPKMPENLQIACSFPCSQGIQGQARAGHAAGS